MHSNPMHIYSGVLPYSVILTCVFLQNECFIDKSSRVGNIMETHPNYIFQCLEALKGRSLASMAFRFNF